MVGKLLRRISLQALENQLTMTPTEGGRSVIKSAPRCDHAGAGWVEEGASWMVGVVGSWTWHTPGILGRTL